MGVPTTEEVLSVENSAGLTSPSMRTNLPKNKEMLFLLPHIFPKSQIHQQKLNYKTAPILILRIHFFKKGWLTVTINTVCIINQFSSNKHAGWTLSILNSMRVIISKAECIYQNHVIFVSMTKPKVIGEGFQSYVQVNLFYCVSPESFWEVAEKRPKVFFSFVLWWPVSIQ